MARHAFNILIVDDEPEVRTLLREFFELEGYMVSEAGNGDEMRRLMAEHAFSLVTLDINLPGKDGFELAREIRAVQNVPIIMISGKMDPFDRVVGLELGADDYITKPFHLREVLARVRAVLRRYNPEENSHAASAEPPEVQYSFGGFRLSPRRRELVDEAGGVVELTAAEFNLLALFVARPTRVLSRDNIMDALKGHDWSPLDRSIDTLIARLRKKIEADTDHPRFIKTVRGVGYVFAAEVRKVS